MLRTSRKTLVASLVVLALGWSVTAQAELVLCLTSTADLDHLQVGQTVPFQVELSGLNIGAEELDSLYATVNYSSELLSAPTLVQPGEIVPVPPPGDENFRCDTDDGLADASFSTFETDGAYHITANGVFFRFETEVLAVGSGNVRLDWVDAFQFDPMGSWNDPPLAGAALDFKIDPVPEPGASVLLAGAIAAVPYLHLRRCRRRRPVLV